MTSNLFAPRDLEAKLEALIFVSSEPLTVVRMVEILHAANCEVDIRDIKYALKNLMTQWQNPERSVGRGILLQEIAHGYTFVSAPEQATVVKNIAVTKPLELSKAQMEVLSIVAYRQPVTRVDIDEIRGVDSSFAIKRLMQIKLIKILGKSEGLGRPLLYGTSKRFLEFFALNSLNDLPTLKQIEALGQGEEVVEVDLENSQISLKDLFTTTGAMFSEDVQRESDEALQSLDEALLRIDSVEKTTGEKSS